MKLSEFPKLNCIVFVWNSMISLSHWFKMLCFFGEKFLFRSPIRWLISLKSATKSSANAIANSQIPKWIAKHVTKISSTPRNVINWNETANVYPSGNRQSYGNLINIRENYLLCMFCVRFGRGKIVLTELDKIVEMYWLNYRKWCNCSMISKWLERHKILAIK